MTDQLKNLINRISARANIDFGIVFLFFIQLAVRHINRYRFVPNCLYPFWEADQSSLTSGEIVLQLTRFSYRIHRN